MLQHYRLRVDLPVAAGEVVSARIVDNLVIVRDKYEQEWPRREEATNGLRRLLELQLVQPLVQLAPVH